MPHQLNTRLGRKKCGEKNPSIKGHMSDDGRTNDKGKKVEVTGLGSNN